MPTVLTFWQTAEDEESFIKYLESTGDVVAFPFGKHKSKSILKPQPIDNSLLADAQAILITLAEHEEEVIYNTYCDDRGEVFSVSPILSPIIGYESGGLSEQGLNPTNVFAYWETRVGEGKEQKWIQKPEWFVSWGKKTFRWLRRHASERLDRKELPMTPTVVAAVAEGLTLVQH